jgi:hypothetical protein
MFGCFAEVKNCKKDLIYGLDTFPAKNEHSNIGSMLAMPFKKYRAPRTDEPVEIEQ